MVRRGVSLVELVIAIFLITLAVLVVAGLFHNGMGAERRAANAYIASHLGHKQLEALRARADNTAAFNNWTSIDGTTITDPEFPNFSIRTDSEPLVVFSPSSQSQVGLPLAQQRRMNSSYRKVRVRVSWGPGTPDRADFWTIIGAPSDRDLALLSLTPTGPVPGSLPRLSTVSFQAQAFDSGNNTIPDIFLTWSVATNTSVGSVNQTAGDGTKGTFKHLYRVDPFTSLNIFGPPGNCAVNVIGRYRGRQAVTKQFPLVLQ